MTKNEQARYAANFMKRRTSRIVGLQNGFNDVMTQFADGYTHDTLEDVNTDNGSPTDTQRVDVADVGDSNFDGRVPGAQPDNGDITGALDILQKHIEGLGNADILAAWASTSDALRKTVTSGAVQASPNADGQTREPLHVPDNTNSQNAGSHGYIPTSELQKMETEAAQLTKMSSRIVGMTSL